MIQRMKLGLFMLVSVGFITGCGSDSDDPDTSPSTAHLGSWATACFAEKDGSGAIESYSSKELIFKEAQINVTVSTYSPSDSTCAGAVNSLLSLEGTYTIGKGVESPALANELDTKPTRVDWTLRTPELVTAYNQAKVCGVDNWELNTVKIITDKVCGAAGGPAMNATQYDVIIVVGPTMKLGENDDTYDSSTAAKRPVKLSAIEDVYTKK